MQKGEPAAPHAGAHLVRLRAALHAGHEHRRHHHHPSQDRRHRRPRLRAHTRSVALFLASHLELLPGATRRGQGAQETDPLTSSLRPAARRSICAPVGDSDCSSFSSCVLGGGDHKHSASSSWDLDCDRVHRAPSSCVLGGDRAHRESSSCVFGDCPDNGAPFICILCGDSDHRASSSCVLVRTGHDRRASSICVICDQ